MKQSDSEKFTHVYSKNDEYISKTAKFQTGK